MHNDKIPDTKGESKNQKIQFTICQDEENISAVENCKKTYVAVTTKQAQVEKTIGITGKQLQVRSANASTSSETSSSVTTSTDDKLNISSNLVTDVYQNRQPLKDLKLIDEEEPMSEGSFIETSEASPMIVDRSLSLTVTPSTPQIKPPNQRAVSPNLYDMDEYREEIFLYLKQAEVI